MWNSFSDQGVSLLRRAAPKCSARDAVALLNGSLPVRSRRCTAACYRNLLYCSFRNVYQPQRYDGAEPYKAARAVAASVVTSGESTANQGGDSAARDNAGGTASAGVATTWLRVLFVNRTQLNWRNAHSKRVASEKRVPEFMPPV